MHLVLNLNINYNYFLVVVYLCWQTSSTLHAFMSRLVSYFGSIFKTTSNKKNYDEMTRNEGTSSLDVEVHCFCLNVSILLLLVVGVPEQRDQIQWVCGKACRGHSGQTTLLQPD